MLKNVPVTVIIPCYRCVKTIERAIRSTLTQTNRPQEIILIDDFSDDDGIYTAGDVWACKNKKQLL